MRGSIVMGGTPKWRVYNLIMDNSIKMDDVVVLLFQETAIYKKQIGNIKKGSDLSTVRKRYGKPMGQSGNPRKMTYVWCFFAPEIRLFHFGYLIGQWQVTPSSWVQNDSILTKKASALESRFEYILQMSVGSQTLNFTGLV